MIRWLYNFLHQMICFVLDAGQDKGEDIPYSGHLAAIYGGAG